MSRRDTLERGKEHIHISPVRDWLQRQVEIAPFRDADHDNLIIDRERLGTVCC